MNEPLKFMGTTDDVKPQDPTLKIANDILSSCDYCEAQEGNHYCLFWGIQIKNMDITTCDKHMPIL